MLTAWITIRSVKWILAALYLLLCALYAYDTFWSNGSLQESLFTLVFCLMLPGIGFLIVWLKDYYGRKEIRRDYSELFSGDTFFKDELKILRPFNREQELNHVPIAEALVVNSYELRRKMVMDTLKVENTLDYLDVLKAALDNEDSETSHYASSIIMQLQEKVQNQMLECQKEFERHPEDGRAVSLYEEELFRLLESDLLEKENLRRYFLEYEKLSDRLLADENPEELHFLHRIQVCFMQQSFTEVPEILERYLEQYPKSEDAVLCKIRLCIQTKDAEELKRFLAGLSRRPVILTQKTLEYIRFFQAGKGKDAGTEGRA